MNNKKLIKQYEDICNKIVYEFSKKQDLVFDGWVGDEVGGIASFIDQYYFNINDLILDLKTNQKKWFITKWQDDVVYEKLQGSKETINYRNYIMGLRYESTR